MSRFLKVLLIIAGIALAALLIVNSLLSHADSCSNLKNQMKERILQSNRCDSDSDCVSYNFDCAFGCNNLVNAAAVEELLQGAREYAKACHHFCPDCPNSQAVLRCEEGICKQ